MSHDPCTVQHLRHLPHHFKTLFQLSWPIYLLDYHFFLFVDLRTHQREVLHELHRIGSSVPEARPQQPLEAYGRAAGQLGLHPQSADQGHELGSIPTKIREVAR